MVVTGGLGPTPDDLTRYAVADVLGVELVTDEAALTDVRRCFERMGRSMPAGNEVQALIPQGAEVLPNARGTAPGIVWEQDERMLAVLPGVPEEMRAMFETALRPRLARRAGASPYHRIVLQTFGMSEADIGTALRDLMDRDRNPLVGTTAKRGTIGIRILARGVTESEARALAEADAQEVRRRLGRAVFGEGDTTLEQAVGAILKKRGLTLATAESCTGGWLAKRITDTPGSSAYFLGGVVTSAHAQKTAWLDVPTSILREHGAVSEPVAAAMAGGCRERFGSDTALATTGIAGPGGATNSKPVGLVYVAFANASGVEVKELRLGEHWGREGIRDRTCSIALNLLRLRLSSDPNP
ncbi:MAG: CinA family nicotinamide mononucleotide deamidase-related protein [Planctomycetota bacterium]|nr:MAG: CinA family nicotinamide mononucleotide deamidase-related protein [Planctomycetota bacterium]